MTKTVMGSIWPCLIGGSIACWPLIWRWSRLERTCGSIPSAIPLQWNTDCGLLWASKRDAKKTTQTILAARFEDGSPVYQLKDPEASRLKCGHRWQPGTAAYVPPARGWTVFQEREDEAEGDLIDQVV